MRERGHRRSPTDLRQESGTKGWLYFGPVPLDDYGQRMEARLLNAHGGTDLILPLQYAQVRRMEGVMHITGKEHYGRGSKGRVEVWRQSWMCAHDPQEAQALLHRVKATGLAAIFGDDKDMN